MSGEAPKDLDTRREETLGAISSASDPGTLEEVRVRTLGKSGWLTEKLKELGKLAAEQRKEAGASLNRMREEFQAFIEKKRQELEQAEVAKKLAKERIDVTLPGRGEARGGLHPVTKVRLRIEQRRREKMLSRIGTLCVAVGSNVRFGQLFADRSRGDRNR